MRRRGVGGLSPTPSPTRSATSPALRLKVTMACRYPFGSRAIGGSRNAPEADGAAMPNTVILDIDGTLVDTNYQHAIAWHRALRAHGHRVQIWKVHRHIGMGGD